MSRKQGNDKARKLYLSGPERRRGVRLEYDDELRIWIKDGLVFFNEKKNLWEPFYEPKEAS